MAKYILSIDNGGSEIKCAIFDLQGNEMAVAGRHLPMIIPEPGRTERDAEKVWEANAVSIRDVIEKANIQSSDILAVGLTGYGNGICLVDEAGKPMYHCIVSTDNRAASVCEVFRKSGAERAIYPKTLQTIWSAQPAALLPWFQKNEPEVLRNSAWALGIKDFIRFKLTGAFQTEVTEASSTCLFNLNTMRFDQEIFTALGMEDLYRLVPFCVDSTAISGTVTEKAAELTGLCAGTPVAGGYFDIDAGALASGILNGDMLCLIAGTWSINEYITKTANTDYDKNANTVTKSYLKDYYLVEDSSPTSASNFDWFVEKFLEPDRPNVTRGELYRECDCLMEKTTPYDSNVVFIPYLFGSATNSNAKGAFFNLSSYHDRNHLIRAVYEGVIFSSMFHVKNLRRQASDYTAARLSGGVAKSSVWAQMMADVLQIPIETLHGSQMSALGAAMGAGVACGEFTDLEDAVRKMVAVSHVYEPRREYAQIYAQKFATFEKALKALDLFHTS